MEVFVESTISQVIVVESELSQFESGWTVQETEKLQDEDEAIKSKYEAVNDFGSSHCSHTLHCLLGCVFVATVFNATSRVASVGHSFRMVRGDPQSQVTPGRQRRWECGFHTRNTRASHSSPPIRARPLRRRSRS